MNDSLSRKERAKLTKSKIFTTSIELISENGYDNVSVDQICKKAGIAKGTFYVHYKSKEDIIRESYYLDMGDYVLNRYDEYINLNLNLSILDKIKYFLNLELEFTKYIGYEMTCLAYVTNLSECIPGPSKHFDRRLFSNKLKDLISEGYEKKEFKSNLSKDDIFLFLESSIRGLMASWCFSNSSFDIVISGNKYIENMVNNI